LSDSLAEKVRLSQFYLQGKVIIIVLSYYDGILKDNRLEDLAADEYGVSVTETEVDKYIKEGPDTFDLPQPQAYAAALGLSIEELNHDFDRDIYEKNVMLLKLKPELEKKYGTTDNNKQVEKYGEEVERHLE
jgi:hypothetical protein